MFFLACSSTQVGLKENWIDERDVIALIGTPMNQWMEKAGRPTLVEISGDTGIYYYNYRPTMYAVAVYDSTTLFKAWGRAVEVKPGLANATEVWGSRKNIMQIKVLNNTVVSATISHGPDKKTLVRDLNGNIVLDPTSGYNANISEEQKINSSSKEFDNAYNSLNGKYTWPAKQSLVGPTGDSASTRSPWEDYRYRQQESEKRAAERAKEEAGVSDPAPEATKAIPEPVTHPVQPAHSTTHPTPHPAAHPAQPEHPAQPTHPVQPEHPVQPAHPATHPAQPEHPAQPTHPAETVAPAAK